MASILVLLMATIALAQAPPAQTGPKRLGRPMPAPGAGTPPVGTTTPPATTPRAGAVTPPATAAPGKATPPKRLGKPVLVPPAAPQTR
ncbi:MAG TPA: hypothetical protein VKU61_12460 [Candidatus Binatia bacterium]|nr:hypothetical protein [Candidatus Binatia bacterium]